MPKISAAGAAGSGRSARRSSASQIAVPDAPDPTRSRAPLLSRSASSNRCAPAVAPPGQPVQLAICVRSHVPSPAETRQTPPSAASVTRSSLPSASTSPSAIATEGARPSGARQGRNCPACSLANRCRPPPASSRAASGSPSRSRSPHAKPLTPTTSPNGCCRLQPPSPLLRRTIAAASLTPTTMSRSPSISTSAAHAPKLLTPSNDAPPEPPALASANCSSGPCSSNRNPPAPASTRSVLKSWFQSRGRRLLPDGGASSAPPGNGSTSPGAPGRRTPRPLAAKTAGTPGSPRGKAVNALDGAAPPVPIGARENVRDSSGGDATTLTTGSARNRSSGSPMSSGGI